MNKIEELAPWCGCGDPEASLTMLHWLLESMNWVHHQRPSEPRSMFYDYLEHAQPGLFWLTLYSLNKLELTEHGGSVRASWLTPLGEELLEAMNALGCNPDMWHIDELD